MPASTAHFCAIRYVRDRGVPLVGTCGGLQHVVLEIARNVIGIEDAQHAETNPDAEHLAVTPLACSLAGQRHPVNLVPGSRMAMIYGTKHAAEPYFCSYGLNPALELRFEQVGLRVSGRDQLGSARIVELDGHPFFVGSLYVFQAATTVPTRILSWLRSSKPRRHALERVALDS